MLIGEWKYPGYWVQLQWMYWSNLNYWLWNNEWKLIWNCWELNHKSHTLAFIVRDIYSHITIWMSEIYKHLVYYSVFTLDLDQFEKSQKEKYTNVLPVGVLGTLKNSLDITLDISSIVIWMNTTKRGKALVKCKYQFVFVVFSSIFSRAWNLAI